MAKPETTDAAATAPKPAAPKLLHVLDTTAIISEGNPTGTRTHELMIENARKPFRFEPGKPLPLPPAIALRFLKTEGFRLTDKDGNVVQFQRPPRQPDELQAGETLTLAENETVARYDELSTPALQHRVLEMTGGEGFAGDKPNRAEMIRFIVERKQALAKANTAKEPDLKPDEFVPGADADEEEAA